MVDVRFLLATVAMLPRVVLACAPAVAGAPLDGLCAVVSAPCPRRPHVAVLSAFPAEQRVLRAAATITERVTIAGRTVLVGRLAGQPVVLALTGIGLMNATAMTEAVLARFDIGAIVFSGVAGSGLRIGDVAVPARWTDTASGRSFAADRDLLAVATRVAARRLVLGRCTPVPPEPPGDEVCLPHRPRVVVGGDGESGDPFGGIPFPCQPGAGEIFGCEARVLASTGAVASPADATDMETAAVAAVAVAHGVPFVAARGVSDGAGDPLGLTEFPFQQFFAYYRLAADNTAAVVLRLLRALPSSGGRAAGRRRHRHMRPAAVCGFERGAAVDCRTAAVPRRVARLVSGACALGARAAEARSVQLSSRAALRWRRAAAVVERRVVSSCCATTLAARLRAAADAVALPEN